MGQGIVMTGEKKCASRALLAICGVAAIALCAPAAAQTDQGTAEAVIVTRLSLIKDDDLEFGTMLAGPTAGSVVVPPTGARTKTGGVILVGTGFNAARFAGYGRQNQNVRISINANVLTLNRVGGGATMQVDTWVIGSTPNLPNCRRQRHF
jgi:hypothetical protein